MRRYLREMARGTRARRRAALAVAVVAAVGLLAVPTSGARQDLATTQVGLLPGSISAPAATTTTGSSTTTTGSVTTTTGLLTTTTGSVTTTGSAPAADPSQQLATTRRLSRVNAYVTYYGWYDNTPPGCSTAYAGCVNGNGSYAHPITFASDSKEFPVGTIVYYPTVEKYFKMRDDCSECDADWQGKGPDGGPLLHHIDLWIGGKGGKEWDVIRCEDALTQGLPNGTPLLTPLIVNPPANLPTSTQPLYDTSSNRCYGGARTQRSYGQYQNQRTHQCLGAGGTTPGSPVVAQPCSNNPTQNLAFDGAFFSVGKLCIAAKGQRLGSRLVFVACSGRRHQLWEIVTGGLISTIQQVACITDVNGTVELGSCKSSNRWNRWTFVASGRSAQVG